MGLDANEKLLADYNDVFADIMNGFLFNGKQIIHESDLENCKDRSQYKFAGGMHEQERDVSKYFNGNRIHIAFLGIEHQNKPEKEMPLRVISYDGSIYRSQLLQRKKAKQKRKKEPILDEMFFPAVTLVLYFGTTHWKYGKTLYEVLSIPDNLKPFVSDYRINVVEVAFMAEE